jgi:YidC/Oxa1 family membrane protein insertase
MKAETRALIAIFLIVLISIVSYRYLPKQPAPRPKPEVTQAPAPVETTRIEAAPPQVKAAKAPPPAEAESVIVETNLYRIMLSSIGGSISSLTLKDFPDLTDPGQSGSTSASGRVTREMKSAFRRTEKSKKPAELIPEGRRAVLSSVETPEGTYSLADQNFRLEKIVPVTDSSPGEVTFSAPLPDGSSLSKKYTFRNGDYVIGLEEACSGNPRKLIVDWGAGLRVTERMQRGYLQYFSAMAMMGGMFKEWPQAKIVKTLRGGNEQQKGELQFNGHVDWAGVKSKYFLACFIPRKEARYFSVDTVGPSELSVRLASEGNTADYGLYLGPLKYDNLKAFKLGLERSVYLGPGWVSGISRLILWILVSLHKAIRNYGVVIIIFGCIMMVVFYPLTFRSLKSMREMQKLQPKITALREKYKSDPQKLNVEMMGIYRKEGINPLGGCLPLLFQMPVFWALFAILRSMIELRGAHFMWIYDLSEKDPYYVLPILMAASMFIQQKFTPQDPRQKTMAYMMPLIMLFIFMSLPAGLVLYWLVYNILSVVQHYILHRRGEEEKPAEA